MQNNISQSVCLCIINEDMSNRKEELRTIKEACYFLDMRTQILLNPTTLEIKAKVDEVTKMKEDEVLDIVCVIHAPRRSFRTFKAADGYIDLYKDIIHPLLCVENSEDRAKLFITSGIEHDIDVANRDNSEPKPLSTGENIVILSSKDNDFTSTFISKLASTQGNITSAIEECKNKICFRSCTRGTFKIRFPSPTSSAEHEFINN